MANVRSGNTHFVDSTGSLSQEKNLRIGQVILTATSANAVIVLSDHAGTTKKLELRVAASGESRSFELPVPMIFPNGINVTTLTNCVATLVYNGVGA